MKTLSFELTMPNNNSWNGKWTGADKKYYIIKKCTDKRASELLYGNTSLNFYHNFGDGWGANVKMEIIDSKEAARRKKISAGFCGYDWMANSIFYYGRIEFHQHLT